MLERVWRAAAGSLALDRVVIATDDDRIMQAAQSFGAEVCMTDPHIASGTDRCNAVLTSMHLRPDVVVNIQGDEPLLPSSLITGLVHALQRSHCDVSTPVSRMLFSDELDDPSVVKVVRASNGHALYFSRSAVPFTRSLDKGQWVASHHYWKHTGVYAMTYQALQRHIALPPTELERMESLEQLRLLEDGARFMCVETDAVLLSVDTADDVQRVCTYLQEMARS